MAAFTVVSAAAALAEDPIVVLTLAMLFQYLSIVVFTIVIPTAATCTCSNDALAHAAHHLLVIPALVERPTQTQSP